MARQRLGASVLVVLTDASPPGLGAPQHNQPRERPEPRVGAEAPARPSCRCPARTAMTTQRRALRPSTWPPTGSECQR